jgi:hypothetical protein
MDVPEDIREKAKTLGERLEVMPSDGNMALIAQALLSERLAQKERDAKIAEETGKAYCRDLRMMGPAGIAHKIALAIRRS